MKNNLTNEYNSFKADNLEEIRIREKRRKPLFKEDNDEHQNSPKQLNRGEVFPTKIFKPDPSLKRKVFQINSENENELIVHGKGIINF